MENKFSHQVRKLLLLKITYSPIFRHAKAGDKFFLIIALDKGYSQNKNKEGWKFIRKPISCLNSTVHLNTCRFLVKMKRLESGDFSLAQFKFLASKNMIAFSTHSKMEIMKIVNSYVT